MDKEALITLTAEIVSAHVSNNSVASGDLGNLIRSVHGALVQADQPAALPEPDLVPAVSIRASVKNDALTCLECGKKLKMLKRHLSTDHAMTPAEYKARWKLAADYPTVAPDYAQKRSDLARKVGLGRKRQVAPPAPVATKPAPARAKAAVAKPAKAAVAKPAKAVAAKPAKASEAGKLKKAAPTAAKQPATEKTVAPAKPRKTRTASPKTKAAPAVDGVAASGD